MTKSDQNKNNNDDNSNHNSEIVTNSINDKEPFDEALSSHVLEPLKVLIQLETSRSQKISFTQYLKDLSIYSKILII